MTGPMIPIKKHRVLAALRERIAAQRAALAESQRATQAGATHDEARPEHAKDTRAVEASYLARGLAGRVEELGRAAALLESLTLRDWSEGEPISVGALVGLENEDGERLVTFLAPAGGGERLEIDDWIVRIVTPRSPLGRTLLGRAVDDEVVLQRPDGSRTTTIVWVR